MAPTCFFLLRSKLKDISGISFHSGSFLNVLGLSFGVESVLRLTYLESVDRIVVEDQGYFKTPKVIVSNRFTLSKSTVLNQCVHNSIRAKI